MKVRELVWSENMGPNSDYMYDHCIACTPFGNFVLTWKSWKEHIDIDIEAPWGYLASVASSLEEAKQLCYTAWYNKVLECLTNE